MMTMTEFRNFLLGDVNVWFFHLIFPMSYCVLIASSWLLVTRSQMNESKQRLVQIMMIFQDVC
jgi:hypothetical protein